MGKTIDSAADRALAARYQFVFLGLSGGMGAERLQSTVSAIKSINPNIKLAQYVMLAERRDPVGPTGPSQALWQTLDANDWWLRDANNKRTQWTTAYSAYNINVTAWASNYSSSNNWALVKSKYDTDTLLSKMKGLDYVYLDFMGEPGPGSADWKNNGTNVSHKDPTVVSEYRKGYMRYVAALRSQNPTLKVIGNISTSAVTSAEYSGQLEGAYRECLMGKSWSIETWNSWEAMMDSYRKALANTKAPKEVFVGACAQSKDAAMYRYGLASTLLEDGYFSFTEDNLYSTMPWYDESEAPLGTAAELPPKAPNSDGIWARKYTNGIVLVNPSKTTTRSYNAAGYYRIKGKYDTVVNNGLAAGSVTLPPRSGLMLLKQTSAL